MNDSLRDLIRELRRAEAAHSTAGRRADELEDRADRMRAAAVEAEEARRQAGATELLAGVPAKPWTGDAPEELARDAGAATEAGRRVCATLPALQAKAEEVRGRLVNAVLTHCRAMRDEAAHALIEGVAGLAGPLARLIAADAVRGALIGERFRFDPKRHPVSELWSGAHLANAIKASLPPRAEPDGFADEVDRLADKLTRDVLANLEGRE